MVSNTDLDKLRATVAALRQHGVVPGVAAVLAGRRSGLIDDLTGAIKSDVAAYTESGNPELIPELEAHLVDVVAEACRLLAGERPGTLDFVADHARRRAEQKFPLDAVLHAYRCVHRSLSRWIRDAALEIADASTHLRRVVAATSDFAIEFTGVLGTQLTSAYVAHTRRIAEAEGDRRTRLMDTLLSGYDESDQVAAQLLRRAGYLQQRQSYCVAIARSVNAEEMANPARAQRMADTISNLFVQSPMRALVGVYDQQVIAILSGTRRLSGWTAPQSLVADRVYPVLRQVGPAALIGLSNDVPSTSHIPRAAREATLALDFADVANRVMPWSAIPFRQILVTQARGSIQPALPAWLEAFTASDTKARGSYSRTLQAYADADMNALRAARTLAIHPNTLYARMKKIREITGLDTLGYHALTEILLVIEIGATQTGPAIHD